MPYLIRYECPVVVKKGKKKLFEEKDQVPSELIDQLNGWLVSNSLYHRDLVTPLNDKNIYANHIFPGKLSYSPESGLCAEFDAFVIGFHSNNFAKQVGDIGVFIKSQIAWDWGRDGFDCDTTKTYSIEFVPSQFHCVTVNVVDEFYVKDVIDDFNSGIVSNTHPYENPKPVIKKEKEKSKIENILSSLKDLEKEICVK